MSAQFLISYAGLYWSEHAGKLAAANHATSYASEADAWYAAYKAGLNPMHCKVVSRDAALAKEVALARLTTITSRRLPPRNFSAAGSSQNLPPRV